MSRVSELESRKEKLVESLNLAKSLATSAQGKINSNKTLKESIRNVYLLNDNSVIGDKLDSYIEGLEAMHNNLVNSTIPTLQIKVDQILQEIEDALQEEEEELLEKPLL